MAVCVNNAYIDLALFNPTHDLLASLSLALTH